MTAIQTAPILFTSARIRAKCIEIDSAPVVMRIWPMVDRKFGSVKGGSARHGDILTLSIDGQMQNINLQICQSILVVKLHESAQHPTLARSPVTHPIRP